jgi:hypothetical protein
MSLLSETTGLLDQLSALSPQQRVLRGLVVVCAVLFLVLVLAVGDGSHPIATVLTVAVALVAAVSPGSHAPLALLLVLGGDWALFVPRDLDGWLLLATVDLFVVHLACTLASYGPAGTTLDRDLLTRWGRRAALCLAVAAGVWLVARVIDFLDLPGSEPGLGAALVAVLAWTAFLGTRLTGRRYPR